MGHKDRIREVLEGLPLSSLDVEFEPGSGSRVIAVVTSDDFERMDEGERQHMVWRKLLDELSTYEQSLVEFVHTMAPSEYKAAHREP